MRLVGHLLLAVVIGAAGLLWLNHSASLLSVASDSMSPTISKGDAVVIRPVNPGDIQIGDIVSYVSPQDSAIVITHRVVQVFPETGRLVARGDANDSADPAVHSSRVIGVVGNVLPGAGRILDSLHTWPGLVLFVYSPLAAILAYELVRLYRYYGMPTYYLHGFRS